MRAPLRLIDPFSVGVEIATRYQFAGEVRGSQIIILEKSFEVLAPSACDNGKRRQRPRQR